jgi:hypothetical protein
MRRWAQCLEAAESVPFAFAGYAITSLAHGGNFKLVSAHLFANQLGEYFP